MTSVVLDASAVLAFVNGEPGGELVAPKLLGGLMSAVNYSEVLKKSVERGGSAQVARLLLQRAQIQVVAFDERHAVEAAALVASTQAFGLSFADRACLALGVLTNAAVFTADQDMAKVSLPVEVIMIRNRSTTKAKKQ